MELPKYIGLKSNSNDKYLRFIHEDTQMHGFLQFSGDEVVSAYVKLEVEPSKTEKGLVHLKCCYNNKYFIRWSKNFWWIIGGADNPEEDQSVWSCTLFKPVFVDDDPNTVRFLHVQLGHYVCLGSSSPAQFAECLYAGSPNPNSDSRDVYTIFNWEARLMMPRHVVFKGDNGLYLKAFWTRRQPHLQFSADDIGDPFVGQQVFQSASGDVSMRSNHFNNIWRRDSSDWIVADTNTFNGDRNLNFTPIKVGDNSVALRSIVNNNFCRRFTGGPLRRDLLSANIPTITREAILQVEEPVVSRQISNVTYRLVDARIYNENIISIDTQEEYNSTQVPVDVEMRFSYTDTQTKTWNTSVQLSFGIAVSFSAGIPFIGDGSIEISAEVQQHREWGQTEEVTTQREVTHRVTVPPMTNMRMRLVSTRASCDVPFSFVQRDILTNGNVFTTNRNDGIFTGTNSFNFRFEIENISTV